MKFAVKTVFPLFMALTTLGSPMSSATESGVKIEHLGVNNTLVRVTGDQKYLLLPIQEVNDEAKIDFLVNGDCEKTINARLAKSKIDYFVPVDLSPYKDKDVVLAIVTSQGRNSIREAKEDACWKNISLSDTFDTSNREKYRPAFHHTPLYGWMNDPNGMVYKDGVWHLYYQYNPYGSKWQNLSWGHSTSTDLINWETHPVAIEPNGLGMVFSGSSAIDKNNTAGFGKDAIISLYTSADVSQVQSLAWSTDNGETFNIYPGNPIITLESEARDPNMFWDENNKRWVLLLAHALEHEMLIFTSSDLKSWTLQSKFGKGLGAQEGVWECPDLFELPIKGTDKTKWVLLCNLNPGGPFGGSATQYFVGDFDGKTFSPDTDTNGNVLTKWLDFGKDHYATVSWSDAPDNRRTVIGWMSNWQYAAEIPTMQFRSANTLPREMELFEGNDGQFYVASVPSPELTALRNKVIVNSSKLSLTAKPKNFSLPSDGICEIMMDIDGAKAKDVNIELKNETGEKVIITYSVDDKTVSFDRRNSGLVDFSQDFPAVTVSPTYTADNKISLRIFIDRSSIELFGNDGRFVMTNLVFPTTPYTTLSVNSTGGNAKVYNHKVYSLKTK